MTSHPTDSSDLTKDPPLSWLAFGNRGLLQVFNREFSRIHRIALEIQRVSPKERHQKLSVLEQWERLQVLDELRQP